MITILRPSGRRILLLAAIAFLGATSLAGCMTEDSVLTYKGTNLTPAQNCQNNCDRHMAHASNSCNLSGFSAMLSGDNATGYDQMSSCNDQVQSAYRQCVDSCPQD
jgi:hypothetical protein